MELRQLRVLQAVGETGSFSAAADRLDYTQPAVSKIVATLERQLGTTLVDRGIRPLRLTEAGSALARRAGAAFEQIDRKSTRLNSSHRCISYAVFCLKKKKHNTKDTTH